MGSSLIDNLSSDKEEQTLEGVKNFGAWLMDGRDDIDSSVCEVLEMLNDIKSGGRIESGGWLIKEKHGGVCEKFDSDRGSLSFSSRDSSDEFVSDSGILTLGKTKFNNNIFNSLLFFLETNFWKSQIRNESEGFTWGESCQKNIVLHDVSHIVRILISILNNLLIQIKFSIDSHIVGR